MLTLNQHKEILNNYILAIATNGVKQHSILWQELKKDTASGSIMSALQRIKSAYSSEDSIKRIIKERLGLVRAEGSTAMRWGNLFEPSIKLIVENDTNTEILGSDLYIPGKVNQSYSPDGIGVLDVDSLPEDLAKKIREKLPDATYVTSLFEFKCPFSRIPDGVVPEQYVSQIKTGLDTIPICDNAVFAEAVFRRCSWTDFGNTPEFNKDLSKGNCGGVPKVIGAIGFYMDDENINEIRERIKSGEKVDNYGTTLREFNCIIRNLSDLYSEEAFEIGDESNDYSSNDLGDCDKKLFEKILQAYEHKILKVWYSPNYYIDDNFNNCDASDAAIIWREFCRDKKYKNYGILPWKAFKVDYHVVMGEPNYVEQWRDQIDEFVAAIKMGNDAKTFEERLVIYNKFIKLDEKFGDGW